MDMPMHGLRGCKYAYRLKGCAFLMPKNDWKTRFYIITAGQTISSLGSSAVQFAIIWWLAATTDSPLVMSMSGLVAFIPMILIGPFAGVWVDRLKLKNVLIAADLFIAMFAAVFAVVAMAGEPTIWLALAVLFMRSVGDSFHSPAIQKAIPMLVPPEELTRANSIGQFLRSGAYMVGPVLGSALYAAFPLHVVMLTDVIGAIAAAASVAMIKLDTPAVEAGTDSPNMLREMKQGALELFRQKKLFVITMTATACMIAYLPLSSLYPLMASSHFRGTEWHGGAAEFAYALGMLLSAALLGAKGEMKNKNLALHMGLLMMGVAALLAGIIPRDLQYFWIFAVLCTFMGAGGNVYNVPYTVMLQQSIPPEAMGRVFSLIGSLLSLAMPVGLLIAGPVAENVGVGMWFLISGIATAVIAVVSLMITGRMEDAPLSVPEEATDTGSAE